MRNSVALALAVAALLVAVAGMLLPRRAYDREDRFIDIFVYPAATTTAGCAVATLPSWAAVKNEKRIHWRVRPAGGPCGAEVVGFDVSAKRQVFFEDPQQPDAKHKHVKAKDMKGTHAYTVTVRLSGNRTIFEDPEIEIW